MNFAQTINVKHVEKCFMSQQAKSKFGLLGALVTFVTSLVATPVLAQPQPQNYPPPTQNQGVLNPHPSIFNEPPYNRLHRQPDEPGMRPTPPRPGQPPAKRRGKHPAHKRNRRPGQPGLHPPQTRRPRQNNPVGS